MISRGLLPTLLYFQYAVEPSYTSDIFQDKVESSGLPHLIVILWLYESAIPHDMLR